ncbi:MAG: tryptophan synthase subunit alpha, partial [Solirubrobacterales bacterium]
VREVSDQSPAPVAVGFGIGTVEQAAEVGRFADGVIIGSRLVALAGEGGPPAVAEFLDQTLAAMADSGRDGLR